MDKERIDLVYVRFGFNRLLSGRMFLKQFPINYSMLRRSQNTKVGREFHVNGTSTKLTQNKGMPASTARTSTK